MASLALAPGAVAADDAPMSSMQFSLPASNGYTLEVKTERSQALVTLSRVNPLATASTTGGLAPSPTKASELHLASTYYVAGSVVPGGIEADLGPLGRIDVRFHPSGRTRTVQLGAGNPGASCRSPRRIMRRLGTFTGTIAFHGENAYALAEGTQAEGSIGPAARPRCGQHEAAGASAAEAARRGRVLRIRIIEDAALFARRPFSAETSSLTQFIVSTSGPAVRYLVDTIEVPQPGLTIERTVGVTGSRESFDYRGDLTTATLRPPAPFSGEATYSELTHELRGDLAVELPGAAAQSLSTPDFEAWLEPKL